ncbi:MAG: class I SAM-dependent methyltransferase [Phycisphaerae bacterium]
MTTSAYARPDSLLLGLTGAVHRRCVHSRRVRALAEVISGLGITPGRWLDIGCGDGQLAQAIMMSNPGVEIVGVDVKPRCDAVIPVDTIDGKRLHYPDAFFDGAILVDVLHHTDDPAAILAEAVRVSRTIIIKDHLCRGTVDRLTLSFMDWFGNAPWGVSCPGNYLSMEQWNGLFRRTRLHLDVISTKLGLYPAAFRFLFERGLHFAARLTRADRRSALLSKRIAIIERNANQRQERQYRQPSPITG